MLGIVVGMRKIHENVVSSFAYLCTIIELSKGKEVTGYDIMAHVSNFGFAVSSGTVYHQLEMLENVGFIRAKPVRRGRSYKTVYVMTEKGMAAFREFKEKWRKPLEYAYRNVHG